MAKLKEINVRSRKTLEAIIALCPHLKEVHFIGSLSNAPNPGTIQNEDILIDEELQLLLSSSSGFCSNVIHKEIFCFTLSISTDRIYLFFKLQVEFIGLESFSQFEREIALNSIGGDNFLNLSLVDCHGVDPVAEFSRLNRLENILIENSTMAPIDNFDQLALHLPPAILGDAGQFLPNLKSLSMVGTCFGHWSRLFECHRPSLSALHLTYCHIGRSSMGQFNWDDTPNLWPNLQKLELFQAGHQTRKLLKKIVPQLKEFKNFKKLVVPETTAILSAGEAFPLGGNQINQRIKTKDLIAQIGNDFITGICIEYLTKSVSSNAPCVYQLPAIFGD